MPHVIFKILKSQLMYLGQKRKSIKKKEQKRK